MPPKDGDAKVASPKPAVRAAASPARTRPAGAAAATASSKPAVSGKLAGASPYAKPAAAAPAAKPAVNAPAPAPAASKPTAKSPAAASTSNSNASKPLGAAVNKAAAAASSRKATGSSKAGTSAAKGSAIKASAAKGASGAAAKKGAATSAVTKAAAAAEPPPTDAGPAPDSPEELARKAEQEIKIAEEMEALRKAAWVAQLEFERKAEAKRRQAREDELNRKKEEAALRKALLEAAYDGEDEQVKKGLDRARETSMLRPDPVDAADGHGNTLLSEAAAGGVETTVAMLLQMGADPNSQGEFKRTPLWRAAFLGKAEVVPVLLEGGADPRIGNEGGELPEHVAGAPIREVLRAWDVARTDSLLQQLETRRQARASAMLAERAQAVRGAEQSVAACEEARKKAQQALKHARMELEKRITEYDTCVEEKKPEGLTQVALDQVHLAEKLVEEARRRATEVGEALDGARLRLRDEEEQQAAEAGEETASLPGIPVGIKALNDVLIRDLGGKIAASGKWPLVIDTSGQASVFLRYQDTNYVNALNMRHLEPQMLRRSLLGAIRYGKAMVLDLQDCDLWPEMPRMFDAVQPGLLASVLDRSLLSNEAFASLIRSEDGEEYDINKFQEARIRSYAFIVLTSARLPNTALLEQTYALRVMITD